MLFFVGGIMQIVFEGNNVPNIFNVIDYYSINFMKRRNVKK